MTHARTRTAAAVITPLLLLAAAGCAHHEETPAPPPPMSSAQSIPQFTAEEYVEGEARIVAVNHPGRKVTLQNARGQVVTVQVPPDVDLNRMKAGDNVLIGLLQSVSVQVMPPGSAELANVLIVGSTPPGQPQGRAWGQQLTIVAEVTAVDLANSTVTLRGAGGNSETIVVRNPEMQQRLSSVTVGDIVELTFSEALATRLLPRS